MTTYIMTQRGTDTPIDPLTVNAQTIEHAATDAAHTLWGYQASARRVSGTHGLSGVFQSYEPINATSSTSIGYPFHVMEDTTGWYDDENHTAMGHSEDYDDNEFLRTTASEWHSGQNSALYLFSCSGTIANVGQLTDEIESCLRDNASTSYDIELRDLLNYVQLHG